MTALNKHAELRQLATDAHERGLIKRYTKGIEANKRFAAIATPLTFLALLDELEAAQHEKDELQQGFIANQEEAHEAIKYATELKEQLARACAGREEAFSEVDEMQKSLDHTHRRRAIWRGRAEEAQAKLEAAERHIAELEARAFNPAILDVIAERQRQQSVEGWTPEHDDEHCNGELAMAAVCYINETGTVNRNGGKPWGWPWDASWWKPKTRRRNLVKAVALILAEIERIDRAAGIGVKGE
jgi:chromosome segregation ATPase